MEANLFITKPEYEAARKKGSAEIQGHLDPIRRANYTLLPVEAQLFNEIWYHKTRGATLENLRRVLRWDRKKLGKVLTQLCEKGMAYRIKSKTALANGYHYTWVLPFATPLPASMRSKKEFTLKELPTAVLKKIKNSDEETRRIALAEIAYREELLKQADLFGPEWASDVVENDFNSPETMRQKLPHMSQNHEAEIASLISNIGNIDPSDPFTPPGNPYEEAEVLFQLYQKAEGDSPLSLIPLLSRAPLRGYMDILGFSNIHSELEVMELCQWIYNHYKLHALFWELRQLCCADELGIRKFVLTTHPGELTDACVAARREIDNLRESSYRALAGLDREVLKRCTTNLRTKLSSEISGMDQLVEHAQEQVAAGAAWTPGLPVMPWLNDRWRRSQECGEDFGELTVEEYEAALEELLSYDVWSKDMLKDGNEYKCEVITGMDRDAFEATLCEHGGLNENNLKTIKKWLAPKGSFQRPENSLLRTFRQEQETSH